MESLDTVSELTVAIMGVTKLPDGFHHLKMMNMALGIRFHDYAPDDIMAEVMKRLDENILAPERDNGLFV